MTDDTQHFVRRLAANVTPVRPLPPPWSRAATWCVVSLAVVGLVVFVMMSRSATVTWADVDRRMLLQQLAALATGITTAAVAFATTIPGYRRWIELSPLIPLSVWLGDLGRSCVRDGLASGSWSLSLIGHWGCLPVTVVVGALPAAMLVVMLRRGAPLTPRLTTVLGALAASGLGNFGVRFIHAADSSAVVLVWHLGAVFLLSSLSASLGDHLFNWRQLADRSHAAA